MTFFLEINRKYPHIADFFTQEWIETELKKEGMEHPIVEEIIKNDEFSAAYLEHIENCLLTLKDEIKKAEDHFQNKLLKNKENYEGALAELEIGLLCKDIGFNIEFEPPHIENRKQSDIKVTSIDPEIFIEVSTFFGDLEIIWCEESKMHQNENDAEWEEIENSSIDCGYITKREPREFAGKFKTKRKQLPVTHPGIIALKIKNTSYHEIPNIIRGLGFDHIRLDGVLELGERKKNDKISAVIIYYYEKAENYERHVCFCNNPLANNPLPSSIVEKFKSCSNWTINPVERENPQE